MQSGLTLLFYPELPPETAFIYQLCDHLGYQISNNETAPFNLALKCFDATFFSPSLLDVLDLIRNEVINRKCIDLSWQTIDHHFAEIFGYSPVVNPQKASGKIIKRPNCLSTESAEILTAPSFEPIDADYVYHKWIDSNQPSIEVPICGDRLPFVFHNGIQAIEKIFSENEIEKLQLFATKMGLEYGKLELQREPRSQQLYLTEVMDTSWQWSTPLDPITQKGILEAMSATFTALIVNRI